MMPRLAIGTGIVLIGIGLIGFLAPPVPDLDKTAVNDAADVDTVAPSPAERHDSIVEPTDPPKGRSITALIPAAFGLLLLLCGMIALNESARKGAMHAAAAIALLGVLLPGVQVIRQIGRLAAGEDVNWRATISIVLMILGCAIFLVFAIHSFVQARRQQGKTEATRPPADA